ncbi:hypothetical protein BDV18DRAFT_147144 [Aspergillus unguis]
MADVSEPSSRRLQTASGIAHLQYPTLPPLSGSVEEWLSRSRPISMTSTPPVDYPQQSLSESWATLSVSDVHSEDGAPSEQTDVGSLVDPSGPDDVASLDERYSSNDEMVENYEGTDNEEYDSESDTSESHDMHPLFPRIGSSIEDSNLTAQTTFRHPNESIEFVEPDKWPEVERVQLKHTIRLIESSEIAELGDNVSAHLQDSTLMATIQQTITKKSLDTDKPFRVLYTGSSEFRGIILDKLGDVLVSSTSSDFESSSTESSRYHVVPTSFGAGAIPNFAELLPIHCQLIVDECLKATSESHTDRPRTIHLEFKNRPACTSLWTGTEYDISSSAKWALPDMAIIFLSSADTAVTIETQKLARMFMERHGVPAMIISEKPSWKMSREPIPVNHQTLHMCLETRHSSTGKTTVLKRYPIDLSTFESITPGQLNKNLASLTSIYSRKQSKSTTDIRSNGHRSLPLAFRSFTRKMLPLPYLNNDTELAFVLRLIMITIISTATLTLGHVVLKAAAVFLSSLVARSVPSNQIAPVTTVHATSVLPTADLKQTTSPVLSSTTREVQFLGHQPNGLSQLHHLMGGGLSKVDSLKPSENYEIQVVGDCHLVIKPPSRSASAKKPPKFNVQIDRRGRPLQYELSRLFEGVYSLKLDRGEAYGLVNVTITTETRPPIKQVLSVDLGTPWLKIANWKHAAQSIRSELVRDMGTAQTGLSLAYGRISTELQVLVGDVVKRTHLLRHKASLLRRDLLPVPVNMDAIVSTSQQLSETFQRTALQPFLSASSVLQYQTKKVNDDAKQAISGTWEKISAGAQFFSPKALKEHVEHARKCKTLDTAHKRARRLLKGNAS